MKFTGRYTAATAKALKGSPRLVCQVTEDGTIYVCNGFLLCTMNPPEYAATVQGFTCCEPGNWTLDKDGKHEDDAHKLDLVRLYADTLKANADAQPLQRSPLTVQTPQGRRRLLLQRRRRFCRDLRHKIHRRAAPRRPAPHHVRDLRRRRLLRQ